MTDDADGRSQRDRMLAGDLYLADDPQLAADALRTRRLQDDVNRTAGDASAERRRILEELLGRLGDDAEIRPPGYGRLVNLYLDPKESRSYMIRKLVYIDALIGETARHRRTFRTRPNRPAA